MKLTEHEDDTNIRAGIIIRLSGTNKILIEHATGKHAPDPCMDIPKGHVTEGEPVKEGACREVFEETGLDIDPKTLDFLGTFRYQKTTLSLYYIEMDFDTKDCYCMSKFKSPSGKMLPEVDGYELFDMVADDLEESLIYKGLRPILRTVFDQLI